jgi:hypothetical protein
MLAPFCKAFPELAALPLERCLLCLVAHSRFVADRSNQFIEYDAGRAAIARTALEAGIAARAFDKVYGGSSFDKMCPSGFRCMIRAQLETKSDGVLWFATTCSSFTWISRGIAKRSPSEPWGDEGREFVANGNAQAIRLALQLLLSEFLHQFVVVEQPVSSLLSWVPPVRRVCEDILTVQYTTTWLGSFSGPTPKPIKLLSDFPLAHLMRRARPNLQALAGRTFVFKEGAK